MRNAIGVSAVLLACGLGGCHYDASDGGWFSECWGFGHDCDQVSTCSCDTDCPSGQVCDPGSSQCVVPDAGCGDTSGNGSGTATAGDASTGGSGNGGATTGGGSGPTTSSGGGGSTGGGVASTTGGGAATSSSSTGGATGAATTGGGNGSVGNTGGSTGGTTGSCTSDAGPCSAPNLTGIPVGQACTTDAECGPSGVCEPPLNLAQGGDTVWFGGYCTGVNCNADVPCPPGSECFYIPSGGTPTAYSVCLSDCGTATCDRTGYTCSGIGEPFYACVPECTANADCAVGLACNKGACEVPCSCDANCPSGETCGTNGFCG